MTKDTKAILKELKTIRAVLDVVARQTAPKPGPDDFDYPAYVDKIFKNLSQAEINKIKYGSEKPPEPPGQ